MKISGVLFGALLACNLVYGQNTDDVGLIKKGAVLKKISSQFSFTEGPAVDAKGNIFFTDQPNNKIWKYDTKGKITLFLDNAGRSNGMFFDKSGNLITCADENNEIWSIDKSGNHKLLLKNFQGKKFNGPNDLWVDQYGGIYFTDPLYVRDYWVDKNPQLSSKNLYYLPKGRTEALKMQGDFEQPNGIVGDGNTLFVADIKAGKTYKYEILGEGKLGDRELFTNLGSDGMTLDSKGNVYLTGKGVTIFNPSGQKIGHIDVPAGWTANVCFGGKKRNVLFITALESVYTLEMNVKGVN